MGEIFNNAINPKADDGMASQLMPCRSPRIRTVKARDKKDGIGGASIVKTGTVFIPTGNNAEERTIRFHEALHCSHTKSGHKFGDLLDQALEDARLHRYCSRSSESIYRQARRDEVCTALRELRKVARMPALTSTDSLATLRALGILKAGESNPRQERLLNRVLARFGKRGKRDFLKALSLLENPANWDKARKALETYFAADYREDTPPPPISGDGGRDDSKGSDSKAPQPWKAEDSPKPKDDAKDDKDDDKDDEDDDKDDEDDDKDKDETSKDEGDDEGDGGDDDGEKIETPSPIIAPAIDTLSTAEKATKPGHPDAYTADLAPECDREKYRAMQDRYPMELRIRRLDMDINRVRLSLGRKAPLPVSSGRQILARKLASVVCNPTVRVFARPVASGGYGTILIDASGSMSIPESMLIDFLSKAPALTLAFYNAPNDCSTTRYGNLYIYAANGYRAGKDYHAPDYGGGNLIDYQAMAWLIKQPPPHFLITDERWTGPWTYASRLLCAKLKASGQIIVVKNLKEMNLILEKRRAG